MVIARTTSIVFDLMQCYDSDSHDTVAFMFRCVYMTPGDFLKSGNSNSE